MKKQLVTSVALMGFGLALIAAPVYAANPAEPPHVDVAAPGAKVKNPDVAAPAAAAPAAKAGKAAKAAKAAKVKAPDAGPAEPVHVEAAKPAPVGK